jgi:shikimate dehydrogenase
MHRLVATVAADSPAGILQALRAVPPEADAAEVRLDAVWAGPPEPEAAADLLLSAVDAAAVPLAATLRPVRQGGRFAGDEAVRVGLLVSAARAGFSFVDLEADVARPALVAELRAAGAQTIVSHHAIGPTPCRDDGLTALLAARDADGILEKFVFSGGSFPDTLRALELASQHAARGGRPCVAALGSGGAMARALLAVAGNHATYGHAGAPAAPGQPSAAEVAALWAHWGLARAELDPVATGPRPWLAVLGMPVAGSLSPRIHNAALRAAGRPERFAALEVPASPGALLLALHAQARIGLAGAAITAPHKRDAARMVPGDAVASAVGAANCIRFRAQAEATNTDATALQRILAPHVDAGVPAVVLGSGGLARAAVWALAGLGAAVRVCSRDASHAEPLVRLGAKWVPWDHREGLRAPVWVQATALGRQPGDPCPVAAAQLRGAALAVEANYQAGPTAFQAAAGQARVQTVGGTSLLLDQAADAYRFWFGQEPDRAAMSRAVAAPLDEVPA